MELLLAVADFMTYRVLLPLSSTCRRLYELIHEESVSGVVQSANSLLGQSVRHSCWRHHPTVRIVIGMWRLTVDELQFEDELHRRDKSFESRVLTSLRCLPSLQLEFQCSRDGSSVVVLHALGHFTQLRSLLLVLGGENLASRDPMERHQPLPTSLSAALLSLTSLISLTVVYSMARDSNAQVVRTNTLQRLARERLLHLTVNHLQLDQLTKSTVPAKRRQPNTPSAVYPNVLSVCSSDRYAPPLGKLLSVFPNVKHVVLGGVPSSIADELHVPAATDAALRLDSLHVVQSHLRKLPPALKRYGSCLLRCLSMRWDKAAAAGMVRPAQAIRDRRTLVSDVLALVPDLTQLALTGTDNTLYLQEHDVLKVMPSVFGTDNVQLPDLTYLQFTGGLLTQDIEYLLPASPTSKPAFAATLTHLALVVRSADRQLAASRLHLLPTLYPSLQKCHIALQLTGAASSDEKDDWPNAIDALRRQLGEVWCDSEEEVRLARSDVEWRRSVGLPDVMDELLGVVVEASEYF